MSGTYLWFLLTGIWWHQSVASNDALAVLVVPSSSPPHHHLPPPQTHLPEQTWETWDFPNISFDGNSQLFVLGDINFHFAYLKTLDFKAIHLTTFWSLTPSLPWCHLKMANENAKFETLKPSCFLFCTGMWKDFHQNIYHWKHILKAGKYAFRCIRTSFSPEVLQAGAGKGLKGSTNPPTFCQVLISQLGDNWAHPLHYPLHFPGPYLPPSR